MGRPRDFPVNPLRAAWGDRRTRILILCIVGLCLIAVVLRLAGVGGDSSADISSMNCRELRSYYDEHIYNVSTDASFETKRKAATEASAVNRRADALGCGDF